MYAGDGVTTTAPTAEQNPRDLFDDDTVVLRSGLFTGPTARPPWPRCRPRAAARPVAAGTPGAYRPMLWLDDAATAIAATVRVPAGTYDVTGPPTNAEIDAALSAAVGSGRCARRRRRTGHWHARSGCRPPDARGERLGGARARARPATAALGINTESRCRHVGPADGDHCHGGGHSSSRHRQVAATGTHKQERSPAGFLIRPDRGVQRTQRATDLREFEVRSRGPPSSASPSVGGLTPAWLNGSAIHRHWSAPTVMVHKTTALVTYATAVVPLSTSFWDRSRAGVLAHDQPPWFILRHVGENRFELQ